mmetsp:Transcript_10818/g.26169  ORF Transcript_10818/g.26169 Transcript_10818/m.26169 type:complete len:91 (+) Transcript_10818:271-543(+)
MGQHSKQESKGRESFTISKQCSKLEYTNSFFFVAQKSISTHTKVDSNSQVVHFILNPFQTLVIEQDENNTDRQFLLSKTEVILIVLTSVP